MIPSEITEDLRKGMSLEDCLIKHNTNLQILFETNLETHQTNSHKYIENRGKRFSIKKKINKRTCYFGSYSSLEDAQKVRDELIRTGWQQNKVNRICEYLEVKRIISKNDSRYFGG